MARLLFIVVSFVIFPDRIHHLVKPDVAQLSVWCPFPAGEAQDTVVMSLDRKDIALDVKGLVAESRIVGIDIEVNLFNMLGFADGPDVVTETYLHLLLIIAHIRGCFLESVSALVSFYRIHIFHNYCTQMRVLLQLLYVLCVDEQRLWATFHP